MRWHFVFAAKQLESLKFTSLFGFLSLFLLVVIVNRWIQHSERGSYGNCTVSGAVASHILPPVFAVTTQLGAFAAAFNVIAARQSYPLSCSVGGGDQDRDSLRLRGRPVLRFVWHRWLPRP